MGKLDLAVGYLSGSMEFAKDHGVGWRREFISQLHEVCPNIDLIDPTNKPGGEEMKIGENKNYQNQLKKSGKFAELAEYVDSYRRYDLRFVDISDFLVVAIDPNEIPQWGTSNETFLGEMQHKPIFFLCSSGAYNFPNWLFSLLEFDGNNPVNIFSDIESLVAELRSFDLGEKELSRKWVLIRKWVELSRQFRLKSNEQLPIGTKVNIFEKDGKDGFETISGVIYDYQDGYTIVKAKRNGAKRNVFYKLKNFKVNIDITTRGNSLKQYECAIIVK